MHPGNGPRRPRNTRCTRQTDLWRRALWGDWAQHDHDAEQQREHRQTWR